MYERSPNSVIESPFHWLPIAVSKCRFDIRERIGKPRSGVFDFIKRGRKTEKVVNGFRFFGNVYVTTSDVPVGAYEKNGPRFGETFSQFAQGSDVGVSFGSLEGEHR